MSTPASAPSRSSSAGGDWLAEFNRLVSLGSPLVLAQLFQMSMGVMDTVMAGRVSAEDLAGVALGGNVLWPSMLLLSGSLMALTPTISQLHGARRTGETGEVARQGLWMAVVLAALLITIVLHADTVYRAVGADPGAVAISTHYLAATAIGLPGLMLFFVLRFLCEGLGRTLPAMITVGAALVIKGVLNWAFIYGHLGLPALGGVGCGYATAIVMWFEAGVMLLVVRSRAFRSSGLFERFSWPDRARIGALIRLGLPIGLTAFFEIAAFSMVTLLISRFGAEVVAGHQIAMMTNGVAFMVPLGVGMAATIRVGHEIGAERPAGARRAAAAAMLASLGFALCAAAVLVVAGDSIAALASREREVAALASRLIGIVALYIFVDAAQATAIGALRGYKDTRAPMMIALFGYWGVALPVGAALGFGWIGPGFGIYGFWAGLATGLATVAALLARRLWRTARRYG